MLFLRPFVIYQATYYHLYRIPDFTYTGFQYHWIPAPNPTPTCTFTANQ
ncbi:MULTISPECIES: hypothetical protein [Dickeya]|nr:MULTISPECIES: hypothetical protein [Dickeya]UGA50996.1 hypothetical protein QR68_21185 [Dickeya fangzhongdai]UWH07348.1 hypothetical protein K0H75_21185 [Dickeya fangzhongdai]